MAKYIPVFKEGTIAPSPERWMRGDVELYREGIDPLTGRTFPMIDVHGNRSQPYKAINTIEVMCRKGTITDAMKRAGAAFHVDFVIGSLESLRAADMGRAPGGGKSEFTGRQMQARDRIYDALTMLGGIQSPAGCCMWFVAGVGFTLKEWAIREGWHKQRPIDPTAASGILIAGLGILEKWSEARQNSTEALD